MVVYLAPDLAFDLLTFHVLGIGSGMTPNGAYSEYVVADAHVLIHIPDSWSFENACQLGHSLFNAAQCLYVVHNTPPPSNQTSWAIPFTNSFPSKTSTHTPSGSLYTSLVPALVLTRCALIV